jgi:acyl-CoA reductase-like NAD-dependent aldehyde dehydrogenase
MTNTTAELETRIEQMVAEHVAAVRKAAQAAVERAFAGASAAPSVAPSRPHAARAAGKRRTGPELLALGERFFEALSRKPGETMAVLSAEVGASPVELQRAVARLREANRVRTIGERSQMRYFPLSAKVSS